MSAANRTTILGKIHKVLKKHYQPVNPPERKVLETLIFSAILENADFETAEEAFAKLVEAFFDWNEIRVTTITELAEVIGAIPDAANAAQRIKKALQAVFETHYQFDLEALQKLNLGKAVSDIEKFPGISPFMVAYTTQNALEGHAIALGLGSWDVLFATNACTEQEINKQAISGLERAIQKSKGVEFFSLLHAFGVDLAASPQSTRVKSILNEIDSGAKERLHQWSIKKAAAEAAKAKQAEEDAREKQRERQREREKVQEASRKAAEKAAKSKEAKDAKAGKKDKYKSKLDKEKQPEQKSKPVETSTPKAPVVNKAVDAEKSNKPEKSKEKEKATEKEKEKKSKPVSGKPAHKEITKRKPK